MKNFIVANKVYCRYILGVLIVLWCTLIFCMSGETANVSSERSGGITRKILEAVLSIFGVDESTPELFGVFEFVIRKSAHMFLYFVLSVLSSLFVYTFDISLVLRSLSSLSFCVLYAASDEFHQLFIEGRSGSIKDVLIDSIGIVLGIVLIRLFYQFVRSRKRV